MFKFSAMKRVEFPNVIIDYESQCDQSRGELEERR
jgi:hypothetical protein